MNGAGARPAGLLTEAWRPYLLLFSAVLLLYYRSLGYGLTGLDDTELLLGNASALSDPSRIGSFFTANVFLTKGGAYYRPLLNLSFMADALLKGPGFFYYHLTNLLLHALSSCLVFALLARLGAARGAALFLALVFALHPAFPQAAAWIPGRNDSLLCVFALLSFLAFLDFRGKPSSRALAACALWYGAALLTKENAVVLPPLAALFAAAGGRGEPGSGRLKDCALAALAVTAGWLLLRSLSPVAIGGGAAVSVLRNLPQLVVFLGKALLPVAPWVWKVQENAPLLPGLAALGLLGAAWAAGLVRNRRRFLFGLAWFVLFLLPSLVELKSHYRLSGLREHRIYLPLVGLLLSLAELRLPARPGPPRSWLPAAGLAVLLALAGITSAHLPHYAGRTSFWGRAVQDSPGELVPHIGLALALTDEGRPAEAEAEYMRALELDPDDHIVHNNLGLLFMRRGDYAYAEAAFRNSLLICPDYATARENLSALLKARAAARK